MTVSETIKKAILAGVGAQEKIVNFIEELIKAGELSKSEGAALFKEWIAKAEQSTHDMDFKIKDAVTVALEKFNIPTHDDFEKMEKSIQALSMRIAKLEGDGGKGGA